LRPPDIGNYVRREGGTPSILIDVEKSAYHHVSQSEIDALAQGIVEIIVEIVVRIGELQGLKPQFLRFVLYRPIKGRTTRPNGLLEPLNCVTLSLP